MFKLKRPQKILVVDDEKEALDFLLSILRRANYEVISATTGNEAVELATKAQPNLIILDIILPDIDGGEVASILARDSRTENIPIIFLTGILRKDEESPDLKTGRRYVLAKPVIKEDLLKTISQVIH